LDNDSAADALQIRCVSLDRFKDKLGKVDPAVLSDIVAAVAILIEAV
jgi:mRNA-degrading endonuclease toxin of MazEF toxin-antitoxin module